MKRLLLLLITFSPLWTMQPEDVNREIKVDIGFIIINNTNKTLSYRNKKINIVIRKGKQSKKQTIDITDLKTIKALGYSEYSRDLPLGFEVFCRTEYKPKEKKYSFTVKVGTKEAESYILARDLKNIAKVNVLIKIAFRPSTGWLQSISHTLSVEITTEKDLVEMPPAKLPKVDPVIYAILGLKPGASAYAILGIPKGTSDKDIRKAYRKRSLIWHPDRYKANQNYTEEQAGGVARLINSAYEVLTKK